MKKFTEKWKAVLTPGNVIRGLPWLLVIALLFGCIYYYNRSQESGMVVQIGRPFESEMDGNISTGVDFSNTDIIKDKETVNTILTAFLQAKPAVPSDMTERKPDAALYLTDPAAYEGSAVTYIYQLWLEENFVIFAPLYGESDTYRELDNDSLVSQVKAIVEEQIHRSTLISGK